jgi:TetR/AcrR family acrAB operon transcriptional repressor
MARKTKEEASRTRQQIIDAARNVFHQHGVARATLEQVASTAGLTRGAVYWHFKDKAELFHAMRADVLDPTRERVDALLFSTQHTDPLDAMEAALKEFFLVLDECPTLRQVLEILVLRCEQVEQFADVPQACHRPGEEFMAKLERVYREAADHGSLRSGLDPAAMALDTWLFVDGLLHVLLERGLTHPLNAQVNAAISAHMSLRRTR